MSLWLALLLAQAAPEGPSRATGQATSQATGEPREPGLSVRVWQLAAPLDALEELLAGQTPNASFVAPQLALGSDARGAPLGDAPAVAAALAPFESWFLLEAEGVLTLPESGRWGLRLASDDGSRLELDGTLVLDHDGLHSFLPAERELELDAGAHALRVQAFQNEGGFGLELAWRRPGASAYERVPAAAFSCRAGEVRVTSPGPKRLLRDAASEPGDGRPLAGVHPSFELAPARPARFEPKVGGLAFLPDGRLAVATWDARGSVWLLAGVEGDDPEAIELHEFASGLAEPLGLCVVEGRLFVLQKQELTELVDSDGDGTADLYRALAAGWPVSANFHEFAFGLVHQGGAFYANLALAIDPGGRSSRPQLPERGSVLRIDDESGAWETVAWGLRTPNGIGIGPDGAPWITDNQGDWLPSSKLLRLEPGAFYGSRATIPDDARRLPVTPPVAWLPQGEIGNSPSQPLAIPQGLGPYGGQLLHGDVTHGGLKRTFVEELEGVWQGCVFRFSQGFEAGVNRLAWGPDGALYVGGIGSTGNWGQAGKQRFGLERLRFRGEPTFEPLAVRACSNGVELELTEPLADGFGWDPESFVVEQWRYEPTEEYGGPKLDEETLRVVASTPSADGKRVFVELEGLREEHVLHLRIADAWRSRGGRSLWTTEGWLTLNRIPRERTGTTRPRPPEPAPNVLTELQRAAGWRLLFDGASLAGWRGYGRPDAPEGWAVEQGALARVGTGGDLISEEEFEDFELELDWRISPGGNSGIFFHVVEGEGAVWATGPEMQVLDDARHPDGRDPRTSAGANYALHAPLRRAARPVGLWNHARLRVVDGHVTHWLNGVRLLDYQLGSEDWEARVAASKFASMPGYGRSPRGHLALQDHGDPVWFRNVRVRVPQRPGR